MNFLENRVGSFKRSVGLAIANRVPGGDFAFGAPNTQLDNGPYWYNQSIFPFGNITEQLENSLYQLYYKPIALPKFNLLRITSISMTHDTDIANLGKGLYHSAPTYGSYEDDNSNHYSQKLVSELPELFLCDKTGRVVIDFPLHVGSFVGDCGNLNFYYDVKADNEIYLFGKGRIKGVPELVDQIQIFTWIGLNYEILSDEKAEMVRRGCL